MARRRSSRLVLPLGIGAILAANAGATGPALAQAQSANLMRPYLDGGALATSRFEPAATFGNPPASGAGRSGFDSSNLRGKPAVRKYAGARAATPAAAAAVPGPIAPARLKPQPNALRPGASTSQPPLDTYSATYADGTAPPVTARVVKPKREEADPYEPLGLRIGLLNFKPALELTGGYDTNPARSVKKKGDRFNTLAPELLIKSDWQRHEFRADLRGSTTRYDEQSSLNAKTVDLKAAGRIDVTARTRADLEGRYQLAASSPGDPDTPAGVTTAPVYTTVSAAAGLMQQFNRLEISLKGTAERTVYEPSLLVGGTTLDNTERNVNQYGGLLRGSYELGPGVKPFVEVGGDQRRHDREFDLLGLQRDSEGSTIRVGTTFELSRKLTGEISAGYLDRRYKDPALQNLRGLIADASLIWTATALTTVTLTAKSIAEETTLLGVSGILKRDATLQVDHALRRWLIASAKVGYGLDVYQGAAREDERGLASVMLAYKLGRNAQVKVEARREWLRSNEPGQDYTTNVYLAGLRFQL